MCWEISILCLEATCPPGRGRHSIFKNATPTLEKAVRWVECAWDPAAPWALSPSEISLEGLHRACVPGLVLGEALRDAPVHGGPLLGGWSNNGSPWLQDGKGHLTLLSVLMQNSLIPSFAPTPGCQSSTMGPELFLHQRLVCMDAGVLCSCSIPLWWRQRRKRGSLQCCLNSQRSLPVSPGLVQMEFLGVVTTCCMSLRSQGWHSVGRTPAQGTRTPLCLWAPDSGFEEQAEKPRGQTTCPRAAPRGVSSWRPPSPSLSSGAKLSPSRRPGGLGEVAHELSLEQCAV